MNYSRHKIESFLQNCEMEAVVLPGLDEAIVGIVLIDGEARVVYEEEVVIDLLVEQGMEREEAIDHYYFNIENQSIGNSLPLFINSVERML